MSGPSGTSGGSRPPSTGPSSSSHSSSGSQSSVGGRSSGGSGSGRPGASTGRPAFGVGPIARVSPSPAVARGMPAPGETSGPYGGFTPRRPFGLPNLRRNVSPHFYMSGTRGAIPIQAPHLLKALIRQDANTSRCQLRGGVHLEQGYVNDVCLTARFNQCVFYEDELTRE